MASSAQKSNKIVMEMWLLSLRRKRYQAAFLVGLMALSLAIAGASMVTPAKGDGTRFSFTLLTNQGNLARITSATIVKENLEDIGIDVTLQIVEWPTFVYENLLGQDFDAIIVGWIGGIDPDIKGLFHSEESDVFEYNFVGYNDSKVDDLLIAARGEGNQTKRQEMYNEIQEIIADEAPYDFLVYPTTIIGVWHGASGTNWEGFVPGPQPNSLRSWWSIKNVTSNDGSTTLIQKAIGAPTNMNPLILADSPSGDCSDPMYPAVIHFDPNLSAHPEVADNWTIGDPATYFEYKFNNTWKWTTTTEYPTVEPVTAEDFMFTLQLLMHANDDYSISQSPYSYVGEWISDVYLVGGDPYHIRIDVDTSTYPGGYAPGFTDLAVDFIPEHVFNNTPGDSIYANLGEVKDAMKIIYGIDDTEINSYPDSYWQWRWIEDSVNRHDQNTGVEEPVTCGYWKFSSVSLANKIELVRNPDFPLWWQAKNPTVIEKFIYQLGGTMDEISLSLQAGEIDIQDGANPAYASKLEADPDVQVLYADELSYTFLAWNERREPFGDADVRRAMCWAIDKEAVYEAAYFGYGSPGTGPIYKALDLWYNPDVEDYSPPNPELAEQMLDDAGWPRQEEGTNWAQVGLIAGIAAAAIIAVVVIYMVKIKGPAE